MSHNAIPSELTLKVMLSITVQKKSSVELKSIHSSCLKVVYLISAKKLEVKSAFFFKDYKLHGLRKIEILDENMYNISV